MTSDSSQYAYYSFPPTPQRLSPSVSRSSSKTDRFTTPQTTPTRADFDKEDIMSSSTAKGQGGPPKTPTKLGKKPGAPASAAKSATKDQTSSKPSTPSQAKSAPGDAKKGLSDAKSSAGGKADKAASDPKAQAKGATDSAKGAGDSAKGAADSAKGAAKGATDSAKGPADSAKGPTDNAQDDDEPLSKVSQASDDASGELKEAAPVPIPDDEDDAADTAGGADAKDSLAGAADQAKDTASGAAGQAKDTASKAGDKAKQTGKQAQDTAQDTTEQAKDTAQKSSDKAKDTAENTTDSAKQSAEDTKDQAEDTVEGATDQAEDAADEDDISDDATEKAGNIGETSAEDTDAQSQDQDQDQDEEGGLLKGAKGLAGKASDVAGRGAQKTSQTASDATDSAKETAEDAKDTAEDTAEDVKDTAEDTTEDAKDTTEDTAEDAKDTAEDTAEDAKATAEDTADDAQDTAEDAKDTAEDTAEDVKDTAEDTADDAQDTAEGVKDSAEDVTGDAQDTAEDGVEGAKDTVEDGAEDAKDTAEDGAEDAKDTAEEGAEDAEDAAEGQDFPAPEGLPLDTSVLTGLEVQADGRILNSDGEQVGRLSEGDAEDLEGYPIGENGEILDEDGDLVGRVELAPEEIRRQLQQAKENGDELPEGADEYLEHLGDDAKDQDDEDEEDQGPALPGLDILEGYTCGVDGLIYDDDGNTIGKVTEGDPEQLQDAKLNAQGEFVDEEGNVVGHADIHEGAAELVEQGVYEAAAPEQADDAADAVEETTEEAKEETEETEDAAEGIEDELPGIEALEGKELNETGEVVDESGDVLGQIEDEELKQKIADGEIDPDTLHIDEEGQVVDEDGNVLSATKLAEGAAEKLAGIAPRYDIRILQDRKVNKKGKVFDDDGEEIGQLIEGEASECAGKKVNEKGQVLDKKGKVIGKVEVSEGEAAQEATKALLEELQEAEGDADDDLPGLDTLDGLKVNKKGQVLNEDGEPIGELVEGEISDCAGKKCNDQGEVLDKEGNVLGKVKTLAPQQEEEPEQEQEQQEGEGEVEGEVEGEGEGEQDEEESGLPPLSILEGYKVNKSGKILDDNNNIIGELVEGDAKKLSKAGTTCDAEGQFWDSKGHVIGRAQTVAQEDADEESPFAGLEGLKVVEGGWVQDSEGNKVGKVTEGDAKKLVGRSVDEDGDILDKKGSVVGHADRYEEEEPEEEPEEEKPDLSFLEGKTVNKAGLVIDNGVPVARVVEGSAKEMAGRKVDGEGQIWNDSGKVMGRVELIPENEREQKPEGPFAGLEGLRVQKDGKVTDENDNVVGIIVEGNAKRLVGLAVDEDGDIVDKYGDVKGHAEPYEEPEEEEAEAEDLSALANCTVNKAGNAVDGNGTIIGHVVDGDVKKLIGKKVDGQGQIWDSSGNVVGRCELAHGEDTAPDGPFAGFEGLKVQKDGTVTTATEDIVGRVVEGDVKKLVSHSVDEDGDILDKNGNRLGKAERWEPEEKERRSNPMSGMRVNKEGEVRDENGDIVGKLTDGNLGHCVGQEIDDNGNVIDQDGNKIGEVTLLENIVEEEYEGPTEEELEEARKREEEQEIAGKMSGICQQTLERVQPICKQISEHMEAADRTPREELDEEDLVNKVKPLIEEGGRILQECNGSLRGLDPDGHIAAQAKGRAGTGEATPEEHRLAETLKELTSTVVTTIDGAKKKLNDMPYAKKKLNPLWGILTQPLFQILAAVGLLLAGVLGLVGQLLNGLGLGGLVNGLLGGLGIDKLLSSFGLGGGDKKKKSNPMSSLPVVGGLLGGK